MRPAVPTARPSLLTTAIRPRGPEVVVVPTDVGHDTSAGSLVTAIVTTVEARRVPRPSLVAVLQTAVVVGGRPETGKATGSQVRAVLPMVGLGPGLATPTPSRPFLLTVASEAYADDGGEARLQTSATILPGLLGQAPALAVLLPSVPAVLAATGLTTAGLP